MSDERLAEIRALVEIAKSEAVDQEDFDAICDVLPELVEGLSRALGAYAEAQKHIVEDLQPEFAKLARGERLSYPWSGEYDERLAAQRLATWWHGAGYADLLERAEGPAGGTTDRLTAWLNDVQLSNRLGVPHYANPGELKKDLRALLAGLAEKQDALQAAAGVLFALPRAAQSKRRREVLAQVRRALAERKCYWPISDCVCGLCEGGLEPAGEQGDDSQLSPEEEAAHGEAVKAIAAEHGFPLPEWQPRLRPEELVGRQVTLQDGDRLSAWPEGFYWSEAEGRPVFAPRGNDVLIETDSHEGQRRGGRKA